MTDLFGTGGKGLLQALQKQIAQGTGSDPSCIFLGHVDPASDDDASLFLRNFASLLNSGGGTMVVGMGEGADLSKVGVGRTLAEDMCERLVSIAKASLDPAPPEGAYRARFPDLGGGRHICVFEISASERRPHAICHADGSLVFLTQDTGTRPLKVGELRREILGSSGLQDVEDHISRRVGAISAGRGKAPLISTGKMIIHIVPEPFQRGMAAMDPKKAMEGLIDFDWAESEWLEVIDGYLGYYSDYSYVHLGNNGALEAVESFKMVPKKDGGRALDPLAYQGDIARIIGSYRDALADAGNAPRLFFSMSLANIAGYSMKLRMKGKQTTFSRDVLTLPLRPMPARGDHDEVMSFVNSFLDMLWQGSGASPL